MKTVGGYSKPFSEDDIGAYVTSGLQVGNHRGEHGWQFYVGYIVQVRQKAGSFGTDIVLVRHPGGELRSHENQMFCIVQDKYLDDVRAMYDDDVNPEGEDYSKPLILDGKFPETGKIIPPRDEKPPCDESPRMQLTVEKDDGTKDIVVM